MIFGPNGISFSQGREGEVKYGCMCCVYFTYNEKRVYSLCLLGVFLFLCVCWSGWGQL